MQYDYATFLVEILQIITYGEKMSKMSSIAFSHLCFSSFSTFLVIVSSDLCILFFLFYSLFAIKIGIQYYISFRCIAYWLEIHIIYKMISLISLVPPSTKYSYYNITDLIPYALHYIPLSMLRLPISTSWSLYLLYPAPPNSLPPHNHQFIFCICEFVSVLCVYFVF